MKLENIKKVELIIKEINEMESFISQLPDNGQKDDKIFFGNSESGTAELKTVFKGENIKNYIKDLKYLVFKNAESELRKLKEQLIEL